MPTIDVSDVLNDPEFRTTFQVRRGTQSINSHGRATLAETTTTQSGVVYPANGRQLFRNAEGEHVAGDIIVISKFRLTNGSGATQADIVTWAGSEWTVIGVNDFSEYGQGFIVATCNKRMLNQ